MDFTDVQNLVHVLLLSVMAILAILNPFGNLPQFLNMTESYPPHIKKRLFRNIGYTAMIIVVTFLFAGPLIMKYLFRVEMSDLRVAGGLILVVMGIKNLLFPLTTKYSIGQDETEDEVVRKSIIPMAFPMLVGPGTLATVIVMATDNGTIITLAAVLIAFVFMLTLFHFSTSIERVFGKLVLHVLARITQVFIVAIGVKMFFNGLNGVLSTFLK